MRKSLTQTEYEEVKKLIDCALDAPNKKEAQKYINRLQYFGYDLFGRAGNIFGELVCYVSNASGRVNDKEMKIYSVRSKLYELESFGVEN